MSLAASNRNAINNQLIYLDISLGTKHCIRSEKIN
jgi:hypothetical protein